jgi:hypothetical protein
MRSVSGARFPNFIAFIFFASKKNNIINNLINNFFIDKAFGEEAFFIIMIR